MPRPKVLKWNSRTVVVRAGFSHTGCAGVSVFEIAFGCEAEN